jgi:hypothetical protein
MLSKMKIGVLGPLRGCVRFSVMPQRVEEEEYYLDALLALNPESGCGLVGRDLTKVDPVELGEIMTCCQRCTLQRLGDYELAYCTNFKFSAVIPK